MNGGRIVLLLAFLVFQADSAKKQTAPAPSRAPTPDPCLTLGTGCAQIALNSMDDRANRYCCGAISPATRASSNLRCYMETGDNPMLPSCKNVNDPSVVGAHAEYEEMMANLYYDEELAEARHHRAERILNAHKQSGQKQKQKRATSQLRRKKQSW